MRLLSEPLWCLYAAALCRCMGKAEFPGKFNLCCGDGPSHRSKRFSSFYLAKRACIFPCFKDRQDTNCASQFGEFPLKHYVFLIAPSSVQSQKSRPQFETFSLTLGNFALRPITSAKSTSTQIVDLKGSSCSLPTRGLNQVSDLHCCTATVLHKTECQCLCLRTSRGRCLRFSAQSSVPFANVALTC